MPDCLRLNILIVEVRNEVGYDKGLAQLLDWVGALDVHGRPERPVDGLGLAHF